MKSPIARLPQRAGRSEATHQRPLADLVREPPPAAPGEQRPASRPASFHPCVFLDALLPSDYYLG